MALVLKDRVKETSTTTGTGTFTLAGAATGFQSFSVIGNSNTVYYAIVRNGYDEWEIGIGTYTSSGTTLSRDTVLESSNSGSKVNFSAGTKEVFCTYPAEKSVTLDDVQTLSNKTLASPSVTGAITFNDASTQNTAATGFGFKNRIINGAMMIDQRNAGASVSTASINPFTVDRWQVVSNPASKFTAQQNAGSITPPAGFTNYLGITSSSAYSSSAGDQMYILQSLEGYSVADLGFGTANAATVTLSFRVYSSLTGTFGGALRNYGSTRSYPFTYTISSANTWTTVSITVAGDTSGTWTGASNAGSLIVFFNLGTGSTYQGTAGAWASADYRSATGATSVVGTSGATFYITGVQLEKGSTATSFDYRPYGTELALCQRYYQKSFPQGTAPAQNAGTTGCAFGQSAAASGCAPCWINFPVVMRATPSTFTAYNPSAANASWRNVSAGSDVNSQLYSSSAASIYIVGNTQTVGQYQITAIHYTVDAEL